MDCKDNGDDCSQALPVTDLHEPGFPEDLEEEEEEVADPSSWVLNKRQLVHKAENFHKGTVLDEQVAMYLDTFAPRSLHFPDVLSFASGCTGSGMDSQVFHAISRGLRTKGVECEFQAEFLCEQNEKKQTWLKRWEEALNLHDGDTLELPCILNDMESLLSTEGDCVQHNQVCQIHAADFFIAGTSCKYFSKINQNKSLGSPHTILSAVLEGKKPTPQHSSLVTFMGMMQFTNRCQPAVLIWENVDSIADGAGQESGNIQAAITCLNNYDYEAQAFLLQTTDYGVPQKRKRMFLVAVNRSSKLHSMRSAKEYSSFFRDVQENLSQMRMRGPSLHELLMNADDSFVRGISAISLQDHSLIFPFNIVPGGELAVRQQACCKRRKEAPLASQRWVGEIVQYCTDNHVKWPLEASDELKNNEWFQCLTRREKDMLVLTQIIHGVDTCVDLSQGISAWRVIKMRGAKEIDTVDCLLPGSR
eukprot:6119999-Amphidinium_carterae.1